MADDAVNQSEPKKVGKAEPLNALQIAELELKQLEIAERKQALQDRKDEAEMRSLDLVKKRADFDSDQRRQSRTKKTQEANQADVQAAQSRCNHRCGGDGATAIATGQGDPERKTCIGGIQFVSGSIKLFCERCPANWWSDLPNGGERNNRQCGTWNEGVTLWRQSHNKVFAVVGGLRVEKTSVATL